MSSPPLIGRLPAQAAGPFVTGSSPPQALIQRCQRLTYEFRLDELAHPVAVRTAACGGRLGGGRARDDVHQPRRPRPRTGRGFAFTPHFVIEIAPRRSERAEVRWCVRRP